MPNTAPYGESTELPARHARVRYRAERRNEEIWKVRKDSPHYESFGPYAVRSSTDQRVVAHSLTLDDLEKRYDT